MRAGRLDGMTAETPLVGIGDVLAAREVVLTHGDLLGACQQIQRERDLVLIHPFDDPWIIAGQGTVGMEILEEAPNLDAVVVGVGGGGLISGIAAAVKAVRPAASVFGVEAEGARAMSRSL